MLWLLIGAGVLVLAVCALLYNRLVKLRNRVDNAWSQVDVQLRRRYDLIPNLVATVKACRPGIPDAPGGRRGQGRCALRGHHHRAGPRAS